MNPLMQLVKFSSKKSYSYSALVDFQQIYIRNVVLFCTGLSMARIFFGENIICQMTQHESVSLEFVNTKCYINGTMTKGENTTTIYHDYYQWVPVYLLLLAFAFYFPFSTWLKCFGHYLYHLENLADKPDEAIQVIVNSKGNFIYFKTWALEIFYMVYVFFLLYVTDVFFNNLWSSSGWSTTAVYTIFPDSGTCSVNYYHGSGSTNGWFNCLLPLCSIYRKIFQTFYVLVLFLISLDALVLFYRIKLLWDKKRTINIWWAFMIVKSNASLFNTSRKLELAYNKILEKKRMERTQESFINLNSLTSM